MLRIALDGEFDATIFTDLVELQDKLEENAFKVTRTTVAAPGVKDPVLVGLAIASLVATSVNALINVINFWKSQRKTQYRVSFETAGGGGELDASTAEALKDALAKGQVTGIKIEKI